MEILRRFREQLTRRIKRESPIDTPDSPHQRRAYDLARAGFLEGAREGGMQSTLDFAGQFGNPYFDALPQALKISPKDKAFVFNLHMNPDWEQNPRLKTHVEQIKAIADKRGNAIIRVSLWESIPTNES